VAGELRFGAYKRGSDRLTAQVEAILSAIEILPLEEPADQHYGKLRALLESRGEMIGPNDMLIAAHALALDCTVVTANRREFSRVPGLKVENWLEL
jgi:tRNA(fMet)-specific endonuclease VapC